MKEELIKYLQKNPISDVHTLWEGSKTYYNDRGIDMGGSYSSIGII